jgi:serine/threonine protein kinase/tetratricopeptide (TPR) repeat protein
MPTLSPDEWQAVSPYLDEALAMSEDERAAWLRSLGGHNPILVAQLTDLLDEHRALVQEGFLEKGQPGLPNSAGLAGQTVGPYTLISQIGRGGMGSVWLAERSDGRFERRVAVKFIHIALMGKGGEARFKREGSILGRLAHPHIAELVDAGVSAAGQPYLVLEYVEGDSIDRYCDQQSLEVEARIRLFLEVLEAVAHAHANLIVHRDLKSSNVLVNKDGQVKLLDFGIAKLLEGEGEDGAATLLTVEGGRAMTPEYAAPEQVTGAPVTTATDVYALGVLLYVLLTGQHPAGSGLRSPAELVKAIVDTEPTRPSDVVTTARAIGDETATNAARRTTTPEKLSRLLRGDLDTIVAKALKKNPRERYASVTALADDLQRYLRHEPISARPDTLVYRTAKFVRRNRTVVALAALTVFAIFVGLVGTLLQARTARIQRDFAFQQAKRSQEHDELLNFLLSDAAPSKALSISDLLARAAQVIEKRHSADPLRRADLLMWIGENYSSEDQIAQGRVLVEKAYQVTRGLSDPSIRARASCALADCLSQGDDVPRAEALVQEGLRELPEGPQYGIDRVACLRIGSQVARQGGRAKEGVARLQAAQRIVQQSPVATDIMKMNAAVDMASAYSDAGQNSESLAEFARAASLLSSLGWEETDTSIHLFNNWALELDQIGRTLEAEQIQRRVLDLTNDGNSVEASTAMLLNNYAKMLRKLNRLDEAARYAQRSYENAQREHNQLVTSQALREQSRIAISQNNFALAKQLISQVEPQMRKHLPPGHYAFAGLAADQARIALGEGDLALALQFANESVAIGETAVKAGGEGAFALPGYLLTRSSIELASGSSEQAVADSNRALDLAKPNTQPDSFSSTLGYAYLGLARALDAQGKHGEARAAAGIASENLQKCLGADHPDTLAARQLAGLDLAHQ